MIKCLKRLGKCWWLVALLIVLSICQVVCDLLLPNAMGKVLDLLQNGQSLDDVKLTMLTAIEMIGIALGSGVFSISVGFCASRITSTMMSKVRYELYDKINNISLSELNKFSVSSLVTRTTNDITQVTSTFNLGFRYVIYAPVMVIGALSFMIIQNSWELTLIVAGAVIMLVSIVVFLVKFVIPKYRTIQEKTDKINLATRESLEGLRVIRAYDAEDYQEKKFEKVNDDLYKTTKFSNRFLGLLTPSMQLVMGLVSLMMAWLGSYLVDGGRLIYSEIAVFTQYSQLLLLGFLMISMILVTAPRSIVSAKRIFSVIETESSIVDPVENKSGSEVGTIKFKNVGFIYPGAEKPVLDNISFSVKKGQTVAFIGATGSGKSTLINLIPRFFDCTSGEVIVDGVNVKEYKLNDLYKKIGYVPQKGFLFHDSLRNNVCLGRPDATDEEFKRALDIAESTDFVSKLTNQENYEISQGGKNVSGGQRQRLSIARAIIMNPEFFIFDDSFSALDYRTDKILRGKIKGQCPGVTNVIVAQRVGTIIDADQIIVLDEGKIVGHGTHNELMKNCPVYIEIASSQLGKEAA